MTAKRRKRPSDHEQLPKQKRFTALGEQFQELAQELADSPRPSEFYLNAVSLAAMTFQGLEEALKMYISTCYKAIAMLSGRTRLAFRYNYGDVENRPLGSLVALFSKTRPMTLCASG